MSPSLPFPREILRIDSTCLRNLYDYANAIVNNDGNLAYFENDHVIILLKKYRTDNNAVLVCNYFLSVEDSILTKQLMRIFLSKTL